MASEPLTTFLETIGAFDDPELEDEAHRCSVGEVSLVLRRDCHGVLRRIEAEFPPAARERLRLRLGALGAWVVVLAGRLELLDVAALGRITLLADRLDVAVRLSPQRDRLRDLLEQVVAA